MQVARPFSHGMISNQMPNNQIKDEADAQQKAEQQEIQRKQQQIFQEQQLMKQQESQQIKQQQQIRYERKTSQIIHEDAFLSMGQKQFQEMNQIQLLKL